jgi:hypothetical protein
MLVNRFTNGEWKGFLNLGGDVGGGEPTCSFWKSTGEVACFGVGTNSAIYVTTFNGGGWTVDDWSDIDNGYLAGTAFSNAGCTTQSTGELVCGVIDAGNSVLWANVYNGSTWSGWTGVGGTGVGSPSCTPLGTGRVVCVIMGINNKLTSVVGP